MSSLFAIVATLLFEVPFIGIEKIVFERKASSEHEHKSLISEKENYLSSKSYQSQESTIPRLEMEKETN